VLDTRARQISAVGGEVLHVDERRAFIQWLFFIEDDAIYKEMLR
jgi:desulfoferrodoxin (superoxide reductase-like protein)